MTQSNSWDEYARLQQLADHRKLDPKAWVADEQADAFLDALAKNILKTDPEDRVLWLENLAINRTKKHRRRAAALHDYLHVRSRSEQSKVHEVLVVKETLAHMKNNSTNDEWSALLALASGNSYDTVAAAQGCSVSALKTRIFRCRRRLYTICA